MQRLAALCLAAFCISPATHAGLFGGRWWKELPTADVVAELPMSLERAKPKWEVGPGLKVVGDDLLGFPVLEHSGAAVGFLRTNAPVEGPCDIVALVRITEEKASHHGATLACGVRGPSAAPESDYALEAASVPATGRFCLHLTPRMGTDANRAYQTPRPPIEDPVRAQWPHTVTISDRYKDISPVWDEAFRLEIEAAMAKVPPVHRTWFELRIEVRPDAVRLCKDGLLVAERRPPGRIAGDVGLWLRGNVRVASLIIRRPTVTPEGFCPVLIHDARNAEAIGTRGKMIDGASMPPTAGAFSVGGVPLEFPSRKAGGFDHIDVGESLFHHRNQSGYYDANTTWPEPGLIDTMRIRLSVPNRPWRRLWLVAASDGEPNTVPIVTARFYRPRAGFAVDAVGEVPLLTARSGPKGTRRLPVTLADGKSGSLWLVPIELDSVTIASRFREEHALSMELTKQVHDYRMYPDPAVYDRFQGGVPSGVRIFAMTLEEAPIKLLASSNRTGNAFVSPEEPIWQVRLANLRQREMPVAIRLTITDPYGKETLLQSRGSLGSQMSGQFDFPTRPRVFGLHRVRTEAEAEGETFSQEGTFVQLPPDTRKATGANSRWGLWWWRGGHLTNPNEEEDLYLLRAAGTRVAATKDIHTRRQWGMIPNPHHVVGGPAPWAYKDPYDPKEYEEFADKVGLDVAARLKEAPDIPYFCIFAENAISTPLTYGILPRFVGEGDYVLNDQEKARIRASILTAKAATEGIRKHAPKAKVSFGWCEPIFSVPFMWEKYPKEYMDAIGVDTPQFERMPEMPIRSVAPNRMWMLQEEMKRCGYTGIPIIHTESYFPSSHPLALGHRTAADYYVRTAVLSLALGTSRFLFCFTLHDCADYWGSVHYGCIGITGPRPEFNPKPAFPALATMTRLLDIFDYDGYVPTGSQSAYCVRFKSGNKFIYCLWTTRAYRPGKLRLPKAGNVALVDENGNELLLTKLGGGEIPCVLSPTPQWVVAENRDLAVELEEPLRVEEPIEHAVTLDPLGMPWSYDPNPYDRYAKNHWDLPRFPGPMKSESVTSEQRKSKVWQITLGDPPKERPLAAWYGVFTPPKPIEIPGKARALGIFANGHSNWGRIIYEIEDAKGEIWQSIGAKDEWNCDDVHSWSYFNFDGRRYIEFPLPNHQPGDNYREKDTVWWNYSAEGIVDLPVKLTRIIIEMRTHNVYVTDLVPVADRSVQLDNLMAVYDSAEAMTDVPVRLQRAAGELKFALAAGSALANPLADLKGSRVGASPEFVKVAPPDQYYDGTRVVVTLKPVAGAKEYRIYVAAYESGAGAKVMAKSDKPELLVGGLRPQFPLFLFAACLDEKGKESKPSAPKRILLKDDFPMK
jgi:hypothetical protein